MSMARLALTDNLADSYIQRGKQSGAVPLGIVSLSLRQSWPRGKDRLSAIQRLNLVLLVCAQHDGLVRGVQVQADDVVDLGYELRVRAEFEGFHAVRLEMMFTPDPLDCRFTQSRFPRHQPYTQNARRSSAWTATSFQSARPLDRPRSVWAGRALADPQESRLDFPPRIAAATAIQWEAGRELPSQNLVGDPIGGTKDNPGTYFNSLRSGTRTG